MKVMVTQNIQTDLDITNGACGTIIDIMLSPDEPPTTATQNVIKPKGLPVCILVKLDRTRVSQLKDLDEGVILVEPVCKTIWIKVTSTEGKIIHCSVHR